MEVSGKLHAPVALPPGKDPLVPIGYEAAGRGAQSQSERGGEEKNYQSLLGLESPIIQSVAKRYTNELFPKGGISVQILTYFPV
jgi:hypothetical protein